MWGSLKLDFHVFRWLPIMIAFNNVLWWNIYWHLFNWNLCLCSSETVSYQEWTWGEIWEEHVVESSWERRQSCVLHMALLDQPVSDVTVGEIHFEMIFECSTCSELHVRTATVMCATNTATGDTAEKKARGRDKEWAFLRDRLWCNTGVKWIFVFVFVYFLAFLWDWLFCNSWAKCH